MSFTVAIFQLYSLERKKTKVAEQGQKRSKMDLLKRDVYGFSNSLKNVLSKVAGHGQNRSKFTTLKGGGWF